MAEEQKIDADIMSSMLTAVNDFVSDSFGTDGYPQPLLVPKCLEPLLLKRVLWKT